jgi:hypothetical protein
MSQKVFISYVFEDKFYSGQLKDWYRQGMLGDYEPVTETDDVRQDGHGAIMGHLRPLLRSADAGIVLVGRDSHNRRWVDREVAYLRSNQKPVILVRIPNTTGAAPPEIRNLPEVRVSPQDVKRALDAALNRR